MGQKFVIGIDEAGRGPLAGPVAAAALCLPQNFQFSIHNFQKKLPLRDSKRLTQKQREAWFTYIKNHSHIFYTTATISPKIIDKINISKAANLAASLALAKLMKSVGLRTKNCRVFLDGGLFLNPKFYILNPRTIIKGDEKISAIMLASIIAKVTRDRIMRRLHRKYPVYGFDQHKGYGTKKHRKAIHKNGLSPIHRRSFTFKK